MSKAVRFALKILENIDMQFLEKSFSSGFEFYRSVNGLLHVLNIRQGDYKIGGVTEEGLIIEYSTKSREEEKFGETRLDRLNFSKEKNAT